MTTPPPPPNITSLDDYIRKTKHPNRRYFKDNTKCSHCLERKQITKLRGCENSCDIMICNSCATIHDKNQEGNPLCMARCTKFTAEYGEITCGAISHCSTLRNMRKLDDTSEGKWDCPACGDILPTWDGFLSHYETCGALPATGPCTHEVKDPYGHILVRSCE